MTRTLYRNSFAGIDAEIGDQVEFGLFKKLGDNPQEESRRFKLTLLLNLMEAFAYVLI